MMIYVCLCVETVWLCEWTAAGGIQRAACINSCHCLWRHSWTGRNCRSHR